MSVMNNHLLSATGSFGLLTANSMARKAGREYQRCTKAGSDDDRRDAAINCAITLWHMNDWVWSGITAAGRDKPELKALLGVNGRSLKKDDLVKWAVNSCPELNICQSICNGSKHVACVGIQEARMTSVAPATTGTAGTLSHLEIVADGVVSNAIDVLRVALEFWHHHATNDNVLR